MEIKELVFSGYGCALQLAWKVFQEYEAPDYTEKGIKEFYESINNPDFIKMLKIYGAFEHNKLIGILATRNSGNHIALFFVEGSYHKKGIGWQLFNRACLDNTSGSITVNSSPFAIEVYHHLGFRDTDIEQTTNGIRYTPMICDIKKPIQEL